MGFEVFSGGGGGSNTPPSSSGGGFAIFAKPKKKETPKPSQRKYTETYTPEKKRPTLDVGDLIDRGIFESAIPKVEPPKPRFINELEDLYNKETSRPSVLDALGEAVNKTPVAKKLAEVAKPLKLDTNNPADLAEIYRREDRLALQPGEAPELTPGNLKRVFDRTLRDAVLAADPLTQRPTTGSKPADIAASALGFGAALVGGTEFAAKGLSKLLNAAKTPKAPVLPPPAIPAFKPAGLLPEFTTDTGAIRQRGTVGQRPALPMSQGEAAVRNQLSRPLLTGQVDNAIRQGAQGAETITTARPLTLKPTLPTAELSAARSILKQTKDLDRAAKILETFPELKGEFKRLTKRIESRKPPKFGPVKPSIPEAVPPIELQNARSILKTTKNPARVQKILETYPELKAELPKLSKKTGKRPTAGNASSSNLPLGLGALRRMPDKMEPLGNGQRVRSLGVSAAKAKGMPQEVQRDLINDMVPGGRGAYDVHSNERTIEWANNIVKTDVRQAERFVRENPGTDLSNTVALNLVKKANAEGRFDDAADLIQQVSETATNQGQAIQSLRLWGNMTPEGMQRYYVKTIGNINRDIEKKAGKLAKRLQIKPEIMADIKVRMENIGRMAEGREKDIEVAKTLDLIASQVPVPFLRKVASIQTMAQLLNPKTAIRNIVGNFGFAGLENVSNVIGTAIDKPLSLITRQRTKVLPSLGAQAKGFKQGWKHGLEDALLGIDTSGISTKFDLPKGRVFRSGPLGFAETALNIELKATDRAFYTAAYEDSLLNQMRAAKVNKPTEEMRNIAHLDGLYRTFQDDNALSNLFTGIKRLLNANKEFGMGDFIIKYPKTPANLIMRGIDYSPAGFIRTVLEASKPLARTVGFKNIGQFNQKAFVESFSRALIGSTALFGTGVILHKLGIITSRPPEDRDLAELQRQSGFGDYRINVSALKRLVFGNGDTGPQKGDTIVSYDWFQPPALSLAIGADVDANKGTASGIVGTVMQALGTGINAFADQPVVQGFQALFSGGYGQIDQGLIKVLEGIPSSFVPTLFNQVRQLMDNQRRETYDPNKTQQSLNRAKVKIPGLAGGLPKKYGTLGQPLETYPGGSNTPFNVFLNPAFVNEYNPSGEVQKVNRVYENTGETIQVPRLVPKKITVSGQDFVLSGSEYSEYQRLVGEYTRQGFAEMGEITDYNAAAKYMQSIITDANTRAKAEILKAKGLNVYKKGNGLAIGK